jgi:hypothetical protein
MAEWIENLYVSGNQILGRILKKPGEIHFEWCWQAMVRDEARFKGQPLMGYAPTEAAAKSLVEQSLALTDTIAVVELDESDIGFIKLFIPSFDEPAFVHVTGGDTEFLMEKLQNLAPDEPDPGEPEPDESYKPTDFKNRFALDGDTPDTRFALNG